MDSQTLELVGQHRLAGELLPAGLGAAFPARDRGVDLIAYADVDPGRPVRREADPAEGRVPPLVRVGRKYERIHDLVFAFVWHLDGTDPPETYALTRAEALAVAEAMGWLATESWTRGGYNTNNPGTKLRGMLGPYRMDALRWLEKITGASC